MDRGISALLNDLDLSWQITMVLVLCLLLAISILWIWYCSKIRQRMEFHKNQIYLADGMDRVNTMSREPGNSPHSTPGFVGVNQGSYSICDLEYALIIQVLRRVTGSEWRTYLDTFKREKMTDDALKLIPCDPGNDAEEMWKVLLVQMGTRVTFKKVWSEEMEQHTEQSHDVSDGKNGQVELAEMHQISISPQNIALPAKVTPGIEMHGMGQEGNETKYEEPHSVVSLHDAGSVLVYGD